MELAAYLTEHHVPFEQVKTGLFHKPGEDSTGGPRYVQARAELLRTPDGYLIALLPQGYGIDLRALETLMGTRPIGHVSEEEVRQVFPEWHGAVPPIGSPSGIRTVVDIHLHACVGIHFVSGREERIRVDLDDYIQAECPVTGCFATAQRTSTAPTRALGEMTLSGANGG